MLAKYSQKLGGPIPKDDADAMFATTWLLNAIMFGSIETDRPSDCWPLSLNDSALQWLSIQRGIRPMMNATEPWREDSIFKHSFEAFNDLSEKFVDEQPGREGLPPQFADLCGITSESTVENNHYIAPLRTLIPILGIKCTLENIPRFINFTARIRPGFFELLQERDPRALLLLAYWYGIACSFDQSWSIQRAKTECTAICMFLDNTNDHRIHGLLEYPARRCGYTLKHRGAYAYSDDEADPPFVSCAPM